ncbi:hypothetical protein Tco_1227249 [Tanacetum coccineum]
MKKAFQDMLHGLGKLIQLMHITVFPEQVKTLNIQAEVQVSRPEDKEVIFSIGSTLEDFICVVFVPVRNIASREPPPKNYPNQQDIKSDLEKFKLQ